MSEACAFAIPDELAGELVGIALVLVSAATEESELDNFATIKQLRAWASDRTISEKIPDKWFVVSEIPKTTRGKVMRNQVAEECLGKQLAY